MTNLTRAELETDPDGAVQAALDEIRRYDLVGFMDNLSYIMNRVGTEAGFTKKFRNLHVNKTRKKTALDALTDAEQQTIREAHALDIAFYQTLRKIFPEATGPTA